MSVAVVALACKLLFRLRVEGREKIPDDGAILIARHRSYWDIPIIAVACGARRRISFVARRSLIRENPLIGIFVLLYAIPIDRENFRPTDYRRVLQAISAGQLVGIFPEGTTKGAAPKIGVVRFAEKTGQKLLPVKIVTHGPYPPRYPFGFPRAEIYIGRPFRLQELAEELPPGLDRREREARLTLMMMERIDTGDGR
ncbi:MAG: 1-acyl-sn-glycerol-3-phosphate acyltransferase [Candidatus Acetothermia bacterium]|nr:1-acyl-sn-glycerol-3-phosphate acyltransferase [Candidatus Acetothermia bacterium]MDH7505035.1 lysophospholipid acyltransferase family protein [Candidatus Acetothermia bacterium]